MCEVPNSMNGVDDPGPNTLKSLENAVAYLKAGNNRSLDPDGIEVAISRQALDETFEYIDLLILEIDTLEYK